MSGVEPKYWIGVASRAHVRAGVAGGFCQLGHGKHEPVKRLKPGDLIAYYSPRETLRDGAPVQAFTAIGEIKPREPYLAEMSPTFQAYRRDVEWWDAEEAPIASLIGRLSFIKDPAKWGYPFRRGSFSIARDDFDIITGTMAAKGRPR
jgi:EVE domain